MAIVLVGVGEDPHLDVVNSCLLERGETVFVVDETGATEIYFDFGDDHDFGLISADGLTVSTKEITAIWWRNKRPLTFLGRTTKERGVRGFIADEWSAVQRALSHYCRHSN